MFQSLRPDSENRFEKSHSDFHTNGHSVSSHSGTVASVAPGNSSGCSVVDAFLTMRGDLESDGDILVKGKVFGNISCKVLIIDADATVEGGINVSEVVVRGVAKGKIAAESVRLERSAVVDCEICQQRLTVEDGAQVKGKITLKAVNAKPSDAKLDPEVAAGDVSESAGDEPEASLTEPVRADAKATPRKVAVAAVNGKARKAEAEPADTSH